MTRGPHESLRDDAHLGSVFETHGALEIEPADDFYQRFVTSILRQQVSMASAEATRERLFSRIDVTPQNVLATDDEILRDCGLSRQKAQYVKNIANAFLDKGYSKDYFADMDNEAVRSELTSISGVGDWTAKMQLICMKYSRDYMRQAR